ncbi:MAG: WD40 repeat domain-containing protein [Ignavibacteriaceae bacterium]|nr:WD40 repeat domain-containing protein [Ignavibacteriaceae bacterium]
MKFVEFKIKPKYGIYSIFILLAIIAVAFFVYKYIENQPKSMDIFLGISLNDDQNDIIYSKGKPDEIYREIFWLYSGFYIGFDKEKMIRMIGYNGSDTLMSIQGIKIGDDFGKVIDLFGKCDSISTSPDKLERLYKFNNYNVFFIFKKDRVIELGIYNPKYYLDYRRILIDEITDLIGASENVISIAVSPNNKFIAGGTDQKNLFDDTGKFEIIIWETKNYKVLNRLHGHKASIQSIVFNSDGSLLASSDSKGIVKMWNTNTWNLLYTISNDGWINELQFSNDNNFLIGSEWVNKTLYVWYIDSGKLVYKLNLGQQIDDFDIHPNNDLLIACCYKELQLWSLREKKKIYSKQFPEMLFSARFNQDGSKFVIGGRNEIILFDTDSKNIIKKIFAHNMPVKSLAISESNEYLISASPDNTIKLWSADDLSILDSLSSPHRGGVNKVEFLSGEQSNEFISSGDDKTVKLWEIFLK